MSVETHATVFADDEMGKSVAIDIVRMSPTNSSSSESCLLAPTFLDLVRGVADLLRASAQTRCPIGATGELTSLRNSRGRMLQSGFTADRLPRRVSSTLCLMRMHDV